MPRTAASVTVVCSFYYFNANDDDDTTADPTIRDRLPLSDAIALDRFGGRFRMQRLFTRVQTINTTIR